MFGYVIWCVCGILVSVSGDDPCQANNFTDPYIGSRNERCPIAQVNHCDFYLKQGWYVVPNAILLNHCPRSGNCGVTYPVWMNGTFPGVTDQIVNRTACFKRGNDCCAFKIDMQVKNCSSHIVYNLQPTNTCSSVYCFESSLPCDPPTTTPTTNTVGTGIPVTTTDTSKTKDSRSFGMPLGLLIGIAVGVIVVVGLIIVVILVVIKKDRLWGKVGTVPTEIHVHGYPDNPPAYHEEKK